MLGRISTTSRLAAAAIDVSVMGTIILGTALIPSLYERALDYSLPAAMAGIVLAEIVGLFDLTHNGTPGKVMLKIRIASSNQREPTERQLACRWFLKYMPLHALLAASLYGCVADTRRPEPAFLIATGLVAAVTALTGLLFAVGYLLMFDSLYQALHDVLSNTCVYDASTTDAQPKGFQVLAPDIAPPIGPQPATTPLIPAPRTG